MAGGDEPPRAAWRDRLESFRKLSAVALVDRVVARYDAGGGALAASGLAYSALFAVVPAILLIAGLAGAVIADEATRARTVETIERVLPPLRGLLGAALDQTAREAGPLTVVGTIGLVWGASRFYVAFESALARIFDQGPRRSLIRRTALGLGSVLVLIGAVLFAAVAAGLGSFLGAAILVGEGQPLSWATSLLLELAGPLATAGAMAVVYRIVPTRRPAWASIGPPAVVVAIALSVVTRAFVFVAPRLIGAAAVLGTLATAFAVLAWFGLAFQAILVGAAWVREREVSQPV